MLGKDRVALTLRGKIADKIPRGELLIEKKLIERLQGGTSLTPEQELRFYEDAGLDLACFSREASLKFFSQNSCLYLFGLINGGLGDVVEDLGFSQAMMKLAANPAEIRERVQRNCRLNAEKGKRLLAAGARGIIIGDDIAYNHGTYISPKMLRNVLFPYLEAQVAELKHAGIPILFHSDGNYMSVVEDLVSCGFSGFQCLEESAGMHIRVLKMKIPPSFCLMGGLDLQYVSTATPAMELEKKVASIMDEGRAGGSFIFGTNGGLAADLDPGIVKNMFCYSEKYATI